MKLPHRKQVKETPSTKAFSPTRVFRECQAKIYQKTSFLKSEGAWSSRESRVVDPSEAVSRAKLKARPAQLAPDAFIVRDDEVERLGV